MSSPKSRKKQTNIEKKALDKKAQVWRENFLEQMKRYKNEALLLSGGLDSGTILAAQLALGGRPRLYTFHLQNTLSVDATAAQEMAKRYDLEISTVVISRDRTQLVEDVKRIIKLHGKVGKALIQCSHPLLYVGEQVKKDGFDRVLIGRVG